MAIVKMRGASRAVRSRDSKRLILTPPRTRKGLLLGSSFCGGALMVLGSTLLMPNAAMAACTQAPTNTWTCQGTTSAGTGEATINPTGNYQVFLGLGAATNAQYTYTDTGNSNAFTLTNAQWSTAFPITMTAGSTITGNQRDGFRYYDTARTSSTAPDVAFQIDGKIYGGANAFTSGTSTGDGFHIGNGSAPSGITLPTSADIYAVPIHNLTINVGEADGATATIKGADDGLFIAEEVTGTASITNYGTIIGAGKQPTATNGGEGIHISTADHGVGINGTGPGADFRIAGAATVTNYGTVTGTQNGATADDATTPATGVSISAKGAIVVANGSLSDHATAIITGDTGVYAYGGGTAADISVTNYGHIGGSNGAGVKVANGDTATITNHSLQSIIGSGGTAGVDAEGFDQVIFNNAGGLTADLTADGAYINNVSGIGHAGETAVDVDNTNGGIIAGATNGLQINDVNGLTSESEANNVFVDNSASYLGEGDFSPGGLIVGLNGYGVSATQVTGNVTIDNHNTLETTLDLNTVDTAVYNGEGESGLLYGFAGGDEGNGTVGSGIYGYVTGIYAASVDGNALVENESGVAVGDTGTGVLLSDIGGNADVYNGKSWRHGDGGVAFGGESGIALTTVSGTAYVDNAHGLSFGGTTSGISIDGVAGEDGGENAAYVDNTDGGVAFGGTTGVFIHGIVGDSSEGDANNVFVDNSASYDNHHWTAGGLIFGDTNGVWIENVVAEAEGGESGNVTIDNQNTVHTSINLNGPTFSSVYDGEGGDALPLDSFASNTGYADSGIYGGANGIRINNLGGNFELDNEDGFTGGETADGVTVATVDGDVDIYNGRSWRHGDGGTIEGYETGIFANGVGGSFYTDNMHGQIYSAATGGYGINVSGVTGSADVDNARGVIFAQGDGSTGISLANVDNGVDIDNSNYQVDPGNLDHYGFIGGAIGINLANIANGITIDNGRGVVYGHEQGIIIDQAGDAGTVNINNSGGSIEGYLQNGIKISEADDVSIHNGDDHGGDIFGGTNASGGSAIDVQAFSVSIDNGLAWWDDSTENLQGGLIVGAGTGPVIALNTSDREGGGASIDNQGIIAALGPTAYRSTESDNDGDAAFSSYLGDVTLPFATDIPLDDDVTPSEAGLQVIYDDASDIQTFVSGDGSGGSDDNLDRYARVANAQVITGEGGATDISNRRGAIIFGTVDLTGVSEDGEGDFTIGNSFSNDGRWFTHGTNTLSGEGTDNYIENNGLIQTAFGSEGETTTFNVDHFYNDQPSEDGYLSLVDGDTTDRDVINGDFVGSTGVGSSYVALDVYFDKSTSEGGHGSADVLDVEGEASGSTGLIIHSIGGPGGFNPEGILVVHADTVNTANACATTAEAALCKAGDTFFISDKSANYQDVSGYGTIHDGMFNWFLKEVPEGDDPDFYLASVANSDAHDQPVVMSELQVATLSTMGTAEEHDYAGTLDETDQGGGGADPTTPSGKTKSALWGRITGNWSDRNISITDDSSGSPLSFDTSLNQNTYSVAGGVEFRPQDGDSAVRLGVYGGYLNTNLAFSDYSATSQASGGMLGGYAALINGPAYVDAEVNANFLAVTYTSSFVTVNTNATDIGILANAGYRMTHGNSFLEPIASFSYLHTTIGQTADITYNGGNSIRAGAGARVGTTFGAAGRPQTEIDLTGKVWDEFGGENVVTVSDGVNTATVSDSIAGVFGEVTGRATLFNADHSGSGFLSVGGTFGANQTAITAKAGLRKTF